LLANILTLLNSAASKQRDEKHISLIRSLVRTCKSAKAGTGYVQKGEAPASIWDAEIFNRKLILYHFHSGACGVGNAEMQDEHR